MSDVPLGLELCAVFRGRVVVKVDRSTRRFYVDRAGYVFGVGIKTWFTFDEWEAETRR